MSNNAAGPTTRDSAEWNNAWEVVRRLAAARRDALHDMKSSDLSARATDTGTHVTRAPILSEHAPGHSVVADSGQYARAIAEIEQASAALRRAEPALEEWLPSTAIHSEPRHPRSVWILVGGIWISTVLVVASAIGATLFLLG
jgi:D-serine deaminase-like pyridoxal phosphate-dependent protein